MNDFFNWIESHPDFIVGVTAIAAIVLSTISMLFGVCSTAKQNEHNRNSVRPVLAIRFGDYSHELYVKIMNIGLGPLFVENLVVTSPSGKEWSSLYDASSDMPDEIGWQDYVSDLNGQPIGAGETRYLLHTVYDSEQHDFHDFTNGLEEVRMSIRDLTIHVRYKDIYGQDMPPCTRHLHWFGRTLG